MCQLHCCLLACYDLHWSQNGICWLKSNRLVPLNTVCRPLNTVWVPKSFQKEIDRCAVILAVLCMVFCVFCTWTRFSVHQMFQKISGLSCALITVLFWFFGLSATRGHPAERPEGRFSDWGRSRRGEGSHHSWHHTGELLKRKEASPVVRNSSKIPFQRE